MSLHTSWTAIPDDSSAPQAGTAVSVGGEGRAIVHRLAGPMLLFSTVLCVTLLASQLFLVPHLAVVQVDGQGRTVGDMKMYRLQLQSQILQSEQLRRDHVLSVHDDTYAALKAKRSAQVPFSRARSEVETQARAATETSDAVQLQSLAYAADGTVSAQGDVHAVGPRSMTVLATFVGMLQKSSLVASLQPPAFTREDSASGPHSPFSFTFHLQ